MKRDRLKILLSKHIECAITLSERQELAQIILNTGDSELAAILNEIYESFEMKDPVSQNDKEKCLDSILKEISSEPSSHWHKKINYRWVASIAASILVLLSLTFMFTHHNENKNDTKTLIAKTVEIPLSQPTSYTRNITLPDGSTVILKAGSSLEKVNNFTGKTREVSLDGEAYFDIAHNKKKPFIIHTGNVKTTVLGTAFNIKAWKQQQKVTVSVTRGRVKVEDDNKTLAILTVNQEIQYNIAEAKVKQVQCSSEKVVTAWAQKDVDFDGVPFNNVLQTLSKRYGVNIKLEDPHIGNVQIVASFSGTESLQNVLDILCTINKHTKYTIHHQNVYISKD